jgi:hypothetical protein
MVNPTSDVTRTKLALTLDNYSTSRQPVAGGDQRAYTDYRGTRTINSVNREAIAIA